MSEVIGKAFEEDIQLYQNRLDNITDTLKSLSAMGIYKRWHSKFYEWCRKRCAYWYCCHANLDIWVWKRC